MSLVNELLNKINQRTAIVGVIGLGYVGLPLAIEISKSGYTTIGIDIQDSKIEMLNKGENYIDHNLDNDLCYVINKGLLSATTNFNFLKNIDCVVICVPTPLDKYHQPDISYVMSTSKEIANYLHEGMLVVLESTTYPGMTEEVVKPFLENTGLKCGTDFFLVFSPERVDPGNGEYNTKNTPKVVGGVTDNCTKIASALYRNVLESEIFEVSSPAVAEMEKILENTFRNINIALANEMAILCHKMGINIWEVIDAAKTKPYGFMAFYPGPGPGGHCIPIDPFYLTWKAREYSYHTKLIEIAGEINMYMPEFVVGRVINILNKNSIPVKEAKIFILGIAYKQDIDDYRESAVLNIIELFEKYGAEVICNDPYIAEFEYKGKRYHSVDLNEDNLRKADMVLITTAHSCYDYDFIQVNSNSIFDTKNAMKNIKERNKIELI